MKSREQLGQRVGIVGIVTNILLFASKIIIGLLFNSIALIADAINNLSDTANSVITLVGFRIAKKPPDEDHPFGHARMEYIAALMVAFVIVFLGLQLLFSSIKKIITPDPIEFSFLMVAVLVFSIIVKLGLYLFYKHWGKKLKSMVLLATGQDSRNDVFASFAILIAVILFYFTGIDLDGIMGGLVALLILYFGLKLIYETVNTLLGVAPSKKFAAKIIDRIVNYDGILGVHDLTIHNYGYKKSFASVHCEVDANKGVLISHDLIDKIERNISEELDLSLVIHLDPVVTDDKRSSKAKKQIEDIVKEISPKLATHDFRSVWGYNYAKFSFDVTAPFNFELKDADIIEMISTAIKEDNNKYKVNIKIDRI